MKTYIMCMNRNIGARIALLRGENNKKQSDLADYLKVSDQTISNYENGRREPSNDDLGKIADFLNTTTDFLINGRNKIVASNISIPIFGVIFAGSPQGAEQDIQGEAAVPENIVKRYGINNLIALKISGDSMDKIVPDGAIGIFNTDYEPIQNGHIYATLIDNNAATLKRVYKYPDSIRFEPESNNPNQQSWTYTSDMDEEVDYVGELVYFSREL